MRTHLKLPLFFSAAAMAVLFVLAERHPDAGHVVLPPVWADAAGEGLAVPACGSSTASGGSLNTCSDGKPVVTFNWSIDGPTPDGTPCESATILVNGGQVASGLPCSGSYTWGNGARNTNYSYEIVIGQPAAAVGHQISGGSFSTPNCISGYCSADPRGTSPGKPVSLTRPFPER